MMVKLAHGQSTNNSVQNDTSAKSAQSAISIDSNQKQRKRKFDASKKTLNKMTLSRIANINKSDKKILTLRSLTL